MERLEVCEAVCIHLVGVLDSSGSFVEDDERYVVDQYRHKFLLLHGLLTSLRRQWIEYCTLVESTCYIIRCTPLLPASPTGETQLLNPIGATGISPVSFFHMD